MPWRMPYPAMAGIPWGDPMAEMTWKERYLAAARHEEPDVVPVSPELFFYIPARVSGYPLWQVAPVGLTLPFHRIKTWEAQLQAAVYFDICGWIVPAIGSTHAAARTETFIAEGSGGGRQVTLVHHTSHGPLRERFWFPPDDAPWHVEHCVKDFDRDWPRYEELFFTDPWTADLSELEEAVEAAGGQGIVSAYVGSPFTDWLAGALEGGYERVVYELIDHPSRFRSLQERYVAYIAERTRMLCERARFDELFMGNEFSEIPLLSPSMWREWDLPVIRAVCEVGQRYGCIVHLHQHGRCEAILGDIADAGVTIVCPLERPPGGDVDLAQVKRRYGDRLCLKGNVETSLLLHGTPEAVRSQVAECLWAGAEGGGFILGTGDQVARDTPFENIVAFAQAGRELGRYPIGVAKEAL